MPTNAETYPPGTNVLVTFTNRPYKATVVATGPRIVLLVYRKPPGSVPKGYFQIIRTELEGQLLALDPDTSPNPAAAPWLEGVAGATSDPV